MVRIFKYDLSLDHHQRMTIPGLCRLLSIQDQDGIIRLWAEVNDSSSVENLIEFMICGTGFEAPDHQVLMWRYFTTIQKDRYVWHIYYRHLSS